MYNGELTNELHKVFVELKEKSSSIILDSKNYTACMESIGEMVSARLAAECEGYVIDLYSDLAERISDEEFFKNPEHLNAFYRLGLREKLDEKYHFDVKSLSSYQKGIDFKEINKLYASAGAAAGTLALGGILKFSLASVISIPFAIIIAGAIAVALAAYLKAVPDINKKRFNQAVEKYLDDMEQDILNWLTEIDCYLEEQVRGLYTL